MATFLFLSGIARPEILGRRELGGQVETMLPVWKSLKDTNFSIAGPKSGVQQQQLDPHDFNEVCCQC